MSSSKAGGNSGKFGRCKDRPSNKRYTAEHRWEKNKKAAIARDLKIKKKAAERKANRLNAKRNATPFTERARVAA